MFERFCKKGTISVFEPASGSGRLLYHLSKLGFDVAGLDLNPHAVAFCNRRLRRHGLREAAHIGNMVSFSLADLDRTKKFDAAFNFVSSFLHLTTKADAQQHLHTIADVMKPGSIYLLGIHLKPKGTQHCSQEHWTVRRGRLTVKLHLTSLSQDLKKRIEMIEMRVTAETPKKRYSIIDRFPFRIYSAKQFSGLLTTVNRFDILETYSFDYDITRPITVTDDSEDVVFILKSKR
jgi:SAM-dependent methyltransferase